MIGNKNADIIRAIKNKKCCKDVVLESLEVTENDTYTAEEGKAWNEVTVNVEGGGSEITMYQAWMKAFNNFETEYFPIAPKKIVLGWAGNVMVNDTSEEPISLAFLGETTDLYFHPDNSAQIYDIEDVPENIYENANGDNFCTFLYDLDELNQYDCRTGTFSPAQVVGNSASYPTIYEFNSGLDKNVSNVALIDGKYYIWFQSWD